MSLINEIVNEIIEIFKSRVEEASRETELSVEEKQAFIDRYLQAFRESLQFSLLKCFGEDSTEADDVEKLDEALRRTTSRRARYPNKAAKMLEKNLETNLEILKVLKTEAPINNCPTSFPRPSDQLFAARQKNMNKLSEDVDACRRSFLENSEKVQNLKKSYQIVHNNMNA